MESFFKILEQASAVFLLIAGLKNVPFFAQFFEKVPGLAVWLNFAMNLVAGWIACHGQADVALAKCMADAVWASLTAAGIHFTVGKIGGATSSPQAATPGK